MISVAPAADSKAIFQDASEQRGKIAFVPQSRGLSRTISGSTEATLIMVQTTKAFSLVEVAIALGIISFALVSMLGLLSVGLQAEKSAYAETKVADLATLVFAGLREGSLGGTGTREFDFDGIPVGDPGAGVPYFHTAWEFPADTLGRPEASEIQWLRVEVSYPADASNPTREVFQSALPVQPVVPAP